MSIHIITKRVFDKNREDKNADNTYYIVTENEGSIFIKYVEDVTYTSDEIKEHPVLKIYNDDSFVKNTGYDIYRVNDTIVNVPFYQSYHTRDGISILGLNSGVKIASVFFGSDSSEVVLIFWVCISSDLDFEFIDDNRNGGQLAGISLPQWLKKTEAYPYKKEILSKYDAHKVIAYLDAEIDILCKIINQLFASTPELKSNIDPDLLNLLTLINNDSILNIKTIESCNSELNTKKEIRILQDKYIKTKNNEV